MKVVFAIPALDGSIRVECHLSLSAAEKVLHQAGIEYDTITISDCPYLPVARNTLVSMFMNDEMATDLFFIDSDVGFDASGVVKILQRPEEIVAGIYPLKRDAGGFPVQLITQDGIPMGRDRLIEAAYLPTGFMRIKRSAFEKMRDAYPDLKYDDNVVEVRGAGTSSGYDFFGMGPDKQRKRWTTEDYAFCQKWRDIGGQCWVMPDIDFVHVGRKAFAGNLDRFLRRQPGGVDATPFNIEKAMKIKGWMTPLEAEWLAQQAASNHLIVELGSAYGRSARAMADNMQSGVIYAIDDWKGPRDAELSDEERKGLYDQFYRNLSDHIQSGRVIPIAADHQAILEFKNLPIPDMVFIDGSHEEEDVRKDISFWLPRLKRKRLICGHDYRFPGVEKAVKELVPKHDIVPGTSIWYWRVE